jgi:hypothetical protein
LLKDEDFEGGNFLEWKRHFWKNFEAYLNWTTSERKFTKLRGASLSAMIYLLATTSATIQSDLQFFATMFPYIATPEFIALHCEKMMNNCDGRPGSSNEGNQNFVSNLISLLSVLVEHSEGMFPAKIAADFCDLASNVRSNAEPTRNKARQVRSALLEQQQETPRTQIELAEKVGDKWEPRFLSIEALAVMVWELGPDGRVEPPLRSFGLNDLSFRIAPKSSVDGKKGFVLTCEGDSCCFADDRGVDFRAWLGELEQRKRNLMAKLESPPIIKLTASELKSVNNNIWLLTYSSVEIARQLTLREQHLFKSTPISNFIRQAWTRVDDPTKAPELKKIIEQFNEMSFWIQTEIVEQSSINDRVSIIEKFIEVLAELHTLNNFQTMFEIVGGLNSASVSRLKRTWGKVSKAAMGKLEFYQNVVSSASNFRTLRETQDALSGTESLLPYIGLFLSDLTFLEDGNPDSVVHGDKPLINVAKLVMIYNLFERIRKMQSREYNLKPFYELQRLIAGAKRFDEADCYERSQIVEKREVDLALFRSTSTAYAPNAGLFEADQTFGGPGDPSVSVKLPNDVKIVVLHLRSEIPAGKIVQHLARRFTFKADQFLVLPPSQKSAGKVWEGDEPVRPGEVKSNLEIWPHPALVNCVVVYAQERVSEATSILIPMDQPLFKLIKILQKAFGLLAENKFSFYTKEDTQVKWLVASESLLGKFDPRTEILHLAFVSSSFFSF